MHYWINDNILASLILFCETYYRCYINARRDKKEVYLPSFKCITLPLLMILFKKKTFSFIVVNVILSYYSAFSYLLSIMKKQIKSERLCSYFSLILLYYYCNNSLLLHFIRIKPSWIAFHFVIILKSIIGTETMDLIICDWPSWKWLIKIVDLTPSRFINF